MNKQFQQYLNKIAVRDALYRAFAFAVAVYAVSTSTSMLTVTLFTIVAIVFGFLFLRALLSWDAVAEGDIEQVQLLVAVNSTHLHWYDNSRLHTFIKMHAQMDDAQLRQILADIGTDALLHPTKDIDTLILKNWDEFEATHLGEKKDE